MAQNKYDLLLVQTQTDKKIRNQPWYKERLKIKYLKSKKPTDASNTLIGTEWSFLKSGLDDFRDGLPPPLDDDNGFLKGRKGPEPHLTGDAERSNPSQTVNRKRFTKHQVVYSKALPLHQMRQDHIEEMEYGLTQHPLALYPHLEECMPPDVFEDVVDILDPEMNLGSEADDEDYDEYDDAFVDDGSQQPDGSNKGDTQQSDASQDDDSQARNPYRWLPGRKEEAQKDKHGAKKRSDSPSQDGHIKDVTKEFCSWVASLGGDSNNVEEATIHSLFASGYETKPALSVPIHVVELTNVPPELRMSAQISAQNSAQSNRGQKSSDAVPGGGYQPSWVKDTYGAWYLNPKTWKKRPSNEPLQDPKKKKVPTATLR